MSHNVIFRQYLQIVLQAIWIDKLHQCAVGFASKLQEMPINKWVDELLEYIPMEVQNTFGGSSIPTMQELKQLSFPRDKRTMGVYSDLLETISDNSKYVYTGCCVTQSLSDRTRQHSNVALAKSSVCCKGYYAVKHNDEDPTNSQFVALMCIPMSMHDIDLNHHRRILCRIGEAIFAILLQAITPHDTSRSKHAFALSRKVSLQIYTTRSEPSWTGLCSHSALMEDLGTTVGGDSKWKRKLDDVVETLTALHGSRDAIPAETFEMAEKRARRGRSYEQKLRRSELDNDPIKRARVNADQRESRSKWTDERRDENNAWLRDYYVAKKGTMTEDERKLETEKNNRNTRRAQFLMAYADPRCTFTPAQRDAVEANDWKTRGVPGLPEWKPLYLQIQKERRSRNQPVEKSLQGEQSDDAAAQEEAEQQKTLKAQRSKVYEHNRSLKKAAMSKEEAAANLVAKNRATRKCTFLTTYNDPRCKITAAQRDAVEANDWRTTGVRGLPQWKPLYKQIQKERSAKRKHGD